MVSAGQTQKTKQILFVRLFFVLFWYIIISAIIVYLSVPENKNLSYIHSENKTSVFNVVYVPDHH